MISFNNLGNYGRLGNQMFQYASLRGIAANRGYGFCIPPVEVFGSNDLNVKQSGIHIHNTFDLSHVQTSISSYNIIEESHCHFDEVLFHECEDNVDLLGYFQTEKYFQHIENDIRKDFSFSNQLLTVCSDFIDEIDSTHQIISLHIRRGDYLNLNSFHPIPSLSYYEEALDQFPNLPVLIFSDDSNWCMEQELFDGDKFLVSTNTSDFDMCLMSMCTHHIIANSSFSWWGAWLSGSKNVIAPEVWFGSSLSDKNTSDLYCKGWKLL